MRVLIVTAGSAGDFMPYTGLGVRLQEAGHEVVLATHAGFEDDVRSRGLDFLPLPMDPRAELSSSGGQKLVRASTGPLALAHVMRMARAFAPELGRGVLAAAERGADVMLMNNAVARLGHLVSRALRIPSMGVYLQPWEPTGAFPSAPFGGHRSLGRWGNRASAQAVLALADHVYATSVSDLRARLGLPKGADSSSLRRESGEWPVRYAYSPTVLPRPADWRPAAQVAGYLWPARPRGWRPDPALTAFLSAGPPPVYVGVGSVVAPDPGRLARITVEALRTVGVRGVVQAGWSGLRAHGDDVLTVDEVPHDWLFPRMVAVVHAAGAGTTAAGLRAGVPAVPVPVQLDQPAWAARLTALGVSPGPVPFRRLTAERLATAIRRAVEDPAYRARARTVAARIAAEDGAGRVLADVERLAAG
ncbi:glycosyltransferase [Streptomyces nondiastaticus]|uniref:Glycosyltransferase n=1 Tax=Streptomyces nondiastaticus TaxID=3154512 RepID=A0ABW6U213_9ACTN